MEQHDAVIVGGGQAGLATSYHLKGAGVEHVVLERSRIAQAWRDRWDSFTLVTPNWTLSLPGAPYDGPDPDGFVPRERIVAYFEAYARKFELPVRAGVGVTGVRADGPGFVVETSAGPIGARNVIVASGSFTRPKKHPAAEHVPRGIVQLHTSAYRSPAALPPGAVLVVGTGQSGVQIAEELVESGRKVILAAGSCAPVPRVYRGKDIVYWLVHAGIYDRTLAQMPSPMARFACTPQATGKGGGHDIGLAYLQAAGATVTGRLHGFEGNEVVLADDLPQSVEKARAFTAKLLSDIDAHIEKAKLDAPPRTPFEPAALPRAPTRIDLAREGVSTVLWATGFSPDYSFVRFPVFDEHGYPITTDGATSVPGLSFVGVHWLRKMGSVVLAGVGEDSRIVAGGIAARVLGAAPTR